MSDYHSDFTGAQVDAVIAAVRNKESIWDGKSTVVANPVITGSESSLTALQIDGTNFSIPQGSGGESITIDNEISSSSTNPVQNRVIHEALSNKAPLASPSFTGIPTAPTANAGTNTTQVATTAFVNTAVSVKASKPNVGSISMNTTWSGSGPYTKTVTVSGATVTSSSKVDIQPDSTVVNQLTAAGVTGLYIENNNGTLTAYAMGAKPTSSMTVQCTITEVNV